MLCEVKQSRSFQIAWAILLFVAFYLFIYKGISYRANDYVIIMRERLVSAIKNDKLRPLGTEALKILDFQTMILHTGWKIQKRINHRLTYVSASPAFSH